MLLIDELDKSDIDLPNDLLHILEESEFEIPVLKRYKEESKVNLGTEENPIWIEEGVKKIDANNLPIIIITSNQERDFHPAFMRRCLYHHIKPPTKDRLVEIATKHLNEYYNEKFMSQEEWQEQIATIVDEFIQKRDGGKESFEQNELATDQLLNALFLRLRGNEVNSNKTLWHPLDK